MNLQLTERHDETPAMAFAGVKLIAGIFFTAAGILLTLDNLDVMDGSRILRYWPVVLIAAGLVKLGQGGGRLFPILGIGIGSLLLASNARWIRFSIFDLWPLALIVGGLVVVAHSFGVRPFEGQRTHGRNVWAVLSTQKAVVDEKNYAGGGAFAVLGGCEVDLTNADFEKGPVVLEVLALMGGVEVKVPEGWRVVGEVMPFMGGVDLRTRPGRSGRVLIIRGVAVWGGIEVKTAVREAV